MAPSPKRSLTIAGHRTSVSIDEEFWEALKDYAASDGKSVAQIAAEIDAERGQRSLSAAIRAYVLRRARAG